MRVLFTCYAEKTHFLAMAPLAWALRTAGHEVVVASRPGFAGVITRAGLTAVGIGRDRDPWRAMGYRPETVARVRSGLPAPYDATPETPVETMTEGYRRAVAGWHKVVNVPLVPDLVAFARAWRPDLVVWEPTTFAGAVAAKAAGAAHARLLFGLDIFGLTRDLYLAGNPAEDPLADWLGRYTDFSEDLVTGHFTIDQLPPPLTGHAPGLTYLPMRYTPYGGPAVVPSWLRTPPARPRVALTLGLVATDRFGGYPIDLGRTLDDLRDLDVELVATVPRDHRPPRPPRNTRLVEFAPLDPLAATCSAVIHHAGFGTLSTVARHALPHLVIPGDVDGPIFADRLTREGVAITAGPDEPLRDHLLDLLGNPVYTKNAEALKAEIDTVPTPNQLVPTLEELARSR
ncbi:DUF1205 domain-containing protein [Herbidospora galbida]|uniref:DUF1205 domain-containing protein n=1 Tax=Herbidospora galbida TaxID=2575442 RepID=A0A4U3LWM0_9ACTN|nr:nucleotide disphospho-sugar-binding domain-containing protein [Herbidospora galbida]TKK79067.1 DUF1205 domain-containing protein [Herbidospora galbida]